jgi:hypothetical protein
LTGQKYSLNGQVEKTTATTNEIAFEQTATTPVTNDAESVHLLIKNESLDRREQICIEELHNNDRKIISFLKQDSASYQYTFNGLARKLEIHPQSLARSLHRLIDLRLIEKSNDGYKLRKSILLNGVIENPHGEKIIVDGSSTKPYVQLIHAYLPLASINDAMVHNLVGKWFGNLRWLGLIETENGYRLQWTNNKSPFLIVVHIASRYLTIETNAMTNKDKVEAIVDGCRIFERLVSMMRQKVEEGDHFFA